MAVTTGVVTEASNVEKEVLSASATRILVYGVNESGAQVELYLDTQTEPFDVVGAHAPYHKFSIPASLAVYALRARCRQRDLKLRVTYEQ